jgi:ADP-ribose pyrophosphatase YjhB (NUDIX family)
MSLYKFCPHCGEKLENYEHEGYDRRKCPSCDFVHYLNPVPAAGCVIFDRGRILMVRRAHEPYIGDWTFPAGFCEWEENPSETAVRELKEETGLDVKITGLFKVYNGNDDPRTNAILILYFADNIGGVLTAADDALEAAFFSESDIPGNIAFESHRQAIRDLKTGFQKRFEYDAD